MTLPGPARWPAPTATNTAALTLISQPVSLTLPASDPDPFDLLLFELVTPPAHGNVTITGNTATYTPHAGYTGPDSFTFRASDGQLISNNATASIDILPANQPPVAHAGPDRSVNIHATIDLDGTASADPDSHPLTFAWRQVGGPVTVIPTLIDQPIARVTLPVPGVYRFRLTVSDSIAQASDEMEVSVADGMTLFEPFAYGTANLGDSYGAWQDSTGVLTYNASINGDFTHPAYNGTSNTGGALAVGNNGSPRGAQRTFVTTAPSGTFWISALLRKGNSTNTDSPVFIALHNSTAAYSNSNPVAGGFGLSGNSSNITPVYRHATGNLTLGSATGYAPNVFHLLIARVQIGNGTDTLDLWVKRTTDTFTPTETSLGPPDLAIPNADFGSHLRNLWIGQINSGNNSNYVDAIRISGEPGDIGLARVLGHPPPANTPPQISPIGDQSMPQGSTAGPIPFMVWDAESAAASLSLNATSTHSTLLPSTGMVFGGAANNRTLTLIPAPDQAGNSTVTGSSRILPPSSLAIFSAPGSV